jgi:YD repeat-containing protein
MNSNRKKLTIRILMITGLIFAGILAIPSLGHAEQVSHSYDDLNRLIKSDYGNGNVIDYAYDAAGNRTSQKVTTATVPNQPHIANAGTNQTVRLGSLVILDGTASTDPTPGTSPLSYAWSQTQGSKVTLNGPNTAKPTFKPTLPGAYKFSLKVKDGQTTSALVTVTITVQDVPIVVFSPNGGEIWEVNASQTIKWYTSKAFVDIHNPVTIRLSQDGGNHWTVIEKEARNTGMYG